MKQINKKMKLEKRYIQQCADCGNYVEGKEMRGFVRQMVHGGPETLVDWVPVGGKLIWKGTKEVARLMLRTNMERWGDELEKRLYKSIRVEYHCPNPQCGKRWRETRRLSESEYRQWVDDIIKTNNDMDKNIRLEVPYQVAADYLWAHHRQQVALSYVEERTVCVSVTLEKTILSKTVSTDVRADATVVQVKDSVVTFRYDAGLGLDLMIKGALLWFKEHIAGFAEELGDNNITVHLGRIPQMQRALEKIALKDISFSPDYIIVVFNLKYN